MIAHPEPAEAQSVPDSLPLLPIRDLVVFPFLIVPLYVSRASSVAAVEEALAGDRLIFLAAQRNADEEAPGLDAIYPTGTVGIVMRMRKMQDGRIKILVQGLTKGRVGKLLQRAPCLRAEVERLPEAPTPPMGAEEEALIRSARQKLGRIVQLGRRIPPEVMGVIEGILHPGRLADLIASHLALDVADAQRVLETEDPLARLRLVGEQLNRELEVQTVQQQIEDQAKEEMTRTQREYYLREQLRLIQAELGEGDGRSEEIEEIRMRLLRARLPAEVETEANKQLRRLEGMNADSAEAAVLRAYLEWLSELPWSERTEDRLDLAEAQRILDQDHAGLREVKERLLEYLAVRKLKQDMRGPILCLAGPPGVGKTSLGKSIAKTLGRSFARVALGGMRDEAEIRGHRRTYVGAMPGRIIQALKQAQTRNPVILLDEIDKVGQDFRGDPAAALLEVLDPMQNHRFRDLYLNVDFDLSEVLFIATANLLETIPPPLRDRMEVIRLVGYTEFEKIEICNKHIIPREVEAHGLQPDQLVFTQRAVRHLIRSYTREAGLRDLERRVASICRKVARRVAEGDEGVRRITSRWIERTLGPPIHTDEDTHGEDEVGVVTGLAWTTAGGELLQVEASAWAGRGGLTLTGHLGDVMKESATAALTWARSQASRLGVDPSWFHENDIHIHVPAGAIPKDGPSAGIAMATALVSLATGKAVRHDVAMSGELSLRGRVLAVGGLQEKLLAAHRHRIRDVFIPAKNENILRVLPVAVRRNLRIHLVRHLDEILPSVLVDPTDAGGEDADSERSLSVSVGGGR